MSGQDRDLLDAGAYGDAHLLCLATSKWVEPWVTAIRRNLEQVRRFLLLSSEPAWVYRIRTTRELAVVYPTGRIEFLEPEAIRVIVAGGSRIDVVEKRMVEFDATTRAQVIARGQGGSLPWLLDELGVRDRLLEPASVTAGTFHVVGLDASGVALQLGYAVDFDPEVAAQVRTLIRDEPVSRG